MRRLLRSGQGDVNEGDTDGAWFSATDVHLDGFAGWIEGVKAVGLCGID